MKRSFTKSPVRASSNLFIPTIESLVESGFLDIGNHTFYVVPDDKHNGIRISDYKRWKEQAHTSYEDWGVFPESRVDHVGIDPDGYFVLYLG